MVIKQIFFALLIPLFLSALFYYLFTKPTPFLTHKSLSAEIKIERDELGIPHIYSDNMHDLLFGMGYAVAEDRLWQMDITRRVAQGRISELLGEKGLEADIFFRNIRMSFHANRLLNEQDSFSISLLQRYVDGVNFYRQTHYLPIEYWIIWGEFEEWTLLDSYIQALLIGLGLNMQWSMDILISNLQSLLGEESKDLFLFGRERKNITTISDSDLPENLKGDPPIFKDLPSFDNMKNFFPPFEQGGASNSWAISGKYTKSGKPLVANDPHLENTVPGFWHTASLHYKDNYYTMNTCPGINLGVVGRTKYLAITATSLRIDEVDIFLEKTEGNSAYYDGQKYELTSFEETIKIKGQDPLKVEFKLSKNGPILKQRISVPGLVGSMHVSSLVDLDFSFKAWFAHNEDTVLDVFPKFFSVKTVYEGREAMKGANLFALDLVMADTEGNIGYEAVGSIPRRKARANGVLPGWTSEFDWDGFVPYEENPYLINPSSGYIITANGFPTSEKYKYFEHMGPYFFNTRVERLTELVEEHIKEGKKFDMEDMVNLQEDYGNTYAKSFVPVLLELISKNEKNEKAVEELKKWDYYMSPESEAAALYSSWLHFIEEELISDRIENREIVEILLQNFYFEEAVEDIFKDEKKEKIWCDDRRTEKHETCDDFLSLTLEKAMNETQGKSWGEMHTVVVKHTPFHGVEILKKIFSLEYKNLGGSFFTPNAHCHSNVGSSEERYIGVKGPNLRVIFDMDSEVDSYYCLQAGNSGSISSRHYSDQGDHFHSGKYFKLSEENQIEAVTVLSPKFSN